MSGVENTNYGFVWNGIHIERMCSDNRSGSYLWIGSKREQMEIRITPGGRISVYNHEKMPIAHN